MHVKKTYIKYLLITIFFAVCVFAAFLYNGNSNKQMTYNEFVALARQDAVSEVIYSEDQSYLQVKLTGDSIQYKIPNPQSEVFLDFLVSHNVSVSYQNSSSGSLPLQILLVLAAAAGVIGYNRQRKKAATLIKDANAASDGHIALKLDDVAGNTEAKAMVTDIIQFIKTPEKYTGIGAKMPHGILFYGPPGTGKTLMAKAIAGEAGVPFYPMSGSDFIQMYVGVGASRIRDLFSTAKKAEKAVIFIDEIDAIGKKRSGHSDEGNGERDQTLNALLTEMSGFNDRDGIIVIAATNRLDTLDEALTRPGRFDRLVEISLPDLNGRLKILNLHAASKKLSDTVDLQDLAKSTVSFSGAMLENLLNEAAIFAANDNCSYIESIHIDKAFYTVIAGAEKADTSYISQTERRVTAYHEAGHSLVTRLLLPDSYISRVTIIPSTQGAGGFSLSIPKDSMYMVKQKMLANMKVLLAGRASEELIFGPDQITTGAGNDIERASKMIVEYITKYGMEENFGLFNSSVLNTPLSSDICELCRNKLNELYKETKELLSSHTTELHNISNALLEKETLNAEDIDLLCS